MKKFQAMLAGLLGWAVLATKDNQVLLTEAESNNLTTMLGAEKAGALIAQANAELAEVQTALEQLNSVTAVAEEAVSENVNLAEQLAGLQRTVEVQAEAITKLSDAPDNAVPTILAHAGKLGAGLAMVFAMQGQLMGYEGKLWSSDAPWNARALSGATGSTTDFRSSVAVDKLNEGFDAFANDNPDKIDSLFNRYFPLPAIWPTVTGVSDRVKSAQMVVGEVTQPRKAKWSPKGDAKIKPETMYVQPAQIDLQFNYWEMQKIENSWLQNFNKEGSQAYKMTFIEFLLTEFTKKARAEDANVLINGVHVEPVVPEAGEVQKSSSYLFRNDGLRKQILDARNANKYRPFNVGIPTAANIVDYIDGIIALIPEEVKNDSLQFILSPTWLRTYKRTYEDTFGQNTDYKGMPTTPKDYPNITFVPLQQMEGSDLMVVTFMDNIKILEYKPEEKAKYTIEKFLRDVYIFADYKIGIGINHIGMIVDEGTPYAETYQAIWTNNVPAMSANFFAVAYDEKTGVLDVRHNRTYVDSGFTTDITKITGNPGDFLVLRGDISLASAVNVKDNANLDLTADFNLKLGGELTLVKTGVDLWKEVNRTSGPAAVSTVVEFADDTIEYSADQYIYKGAAADTLAEIIGGVEGNKVRIYGQATNTLTIDNVAGKIKISGAAYVLNTEAKYMDLIFLNGVWTEMARG